MKAKPRSPRRQGRKAYHFTAPNFSTASPELGAPSLRTKRLRQRYEENRVRAILRRLDPSALELGPTSLYNIVCKEFKKDPLVKDHGLKIPSPSTVKRAATEERAARAVK